MNDNDKYMSGSLTRAAFGPLDCGQLLTDDADTYRGTDSLPDLRKCTMENNRWYFLGIFHEFVYACQKFCRWPIYTSNDVTPDMVFIADIDDQKILPRCEAWIFHHGCEVL